MSDQPVLLVRLYGKNMETNTVLPRSLDKDHSFCQRSLQNT